MSAISQRHDSRQLGSDDVQLDLPFPAKDLILKLGLAAEIWFDGNATRKWYFRPTARVQQLPETLIPFLPKPPQPERGRSYLEYPLGRDSARAQGLVWDTAGQLYYFPDSPDVLPESLRKHIPARFTWGAWLQSRYSPSLELCRAPLANDIAVTAPTLELANEIYRALHSDQSGFLWVRAPETRRALEAWQATVACLRGTPSSILIVTALTDVPLWHHVLESTGTGPNDVVVFSYEGLSFFNSRKLRQTLAGFSPSVIVWDQAHFLRSTTAPYSRSGHFLANRAFNFWISECPAALPKDLHFLAPLLSYRDGTNPPADWYFQGFAARNGQSAWLRFRPGPDLQAHNQYLQELLFQRDYYGIRGGLSFESSAQAHLRISIRPIPTATEIADMVASICQMTRSYFHEQHQVLIIVKEDQLIAMIEAGLSQAKAASLVMLPSSAQTPQNLQEWLFKARCAIIHPSHLQPGATTDIPRQRVILALHMPAAATDFAKLAALSGPHTTIVVPYEVGTSQQDYAMGLDVHSLSSICTEACGPTTIERF